MVRSTDSTPPSLQRPACPKYVHVQRSGHLFLEGFSEARHDDVEQSVTSVRNNAGPFEPRFP